MPWGNGRKIALTLFGILAAVAFCFIVWSTLGEKNWTSNPTEGVPDISPAAVSTKEAKQTSEAKNIIEQKIERGELSKHPARNYHKVR